MVPQPLSTVALVNVSKEFSTFLRASTAATNSVSTSSPRIACFVSSSTLACASMYPEARFVSLSIDFSERVLPLLSTSFCIIITIPAGVDDLSSAKCLNSLPAVVPILDNSSINPGTASALPEAIALLISSRPARTPISSFLDDSLPRESSVIMFTRSDVSIEDSLFLFSCIFCLDI